jgi:hypothetical protein
VADHKVAALEIDLLPPQLPYFVLPHGRVEGQDNGRMARAVQTTGGIHEALFLASSHRAAYLLTLPQRSHLVFER